MTDIVLDSTEYEVISGEFGGGPTQPPPPYSPIDANDSLSSNQTLRLLFAIGEGEIASVDGVYVNGTPSSSFSCTTATRLGTASQSYIPGFAAVETPYAGTGIAAQLLYGTPYSRAVSSTRVDSVRLTIRLQGLQQVQINGDKTGYTVEFDIYTRKSRTDFWTLVGNTVKTGKASQPYSWDVGISKPSGGTTWEFKIERVTPNDTASSVSISFIDSYTEIQYDKLSYNNTALVGLTFKDSKQLGGGVPTISFTAHGRKIKVPTSAVYDPATKVYSSPTWDGTWSLTNYASDCPAWILYDILTHDRVGLGSNINETDVDKFSFFELAKFCDASVSNGFGGTEARFTMSVQFYVRENAATILTYLLAICNANLTTVNGLITVVSDRPVSPSKLVVNSNVVDSDFQYSSAELSERITSVNVTFNNPSDKYNTTTITEVDNTLIARYGLQTMDVVLVGCVSEGQARRKARWVLSTTAITTNVLIFKNAFEGMNYSIGEVINVLDDNAANVLQQGLVKSRSTLGGVTTIVLDRSLAFGISSNILTYAANGSTILDTSINEVSVTTDTVTMTALSSLPAVGSPYIIKAAVIPRPWRVSAISVDDHIHTITCTEYNATKYNYIDTGIAVPIGKPPYLNIEEFTTPKVSGIQFNVVHTASGIHSGSKLVVHWAWAPIGTLKYKATYLVLWRRDSLPFTAITDVQQKEVEIDKIVPGIYEVIVYAFNIRGIKSEGVSQTYSYRTTAGTSTLSPPINFYVKGTVANIFATENLPLTWDYNPVNDNTSDRLLDYQLEVWTNNGATKLNTYIVPPNKVKGGEFVYTLTMNRNDYGLTTPNRSPQFKIYSRDLVGDLSVASLKTFNNPAPPAPSFTLIAGLSTMYINITPVDVIDLRGYIVYKGSTANFTKAGKEAYVGPDPYVTLAVGNSNKKYIAVAAFDSFGRTGLNISTEQNVTPLSLEAINWTRTGLTISVNKTTHVISWTAGVVYEGSNVYQVAKGSKTWTIGTLYLYFNPNISKTTLQTTTTLGLAVAQGGWPYATYTGGDMSTVKGGDGQAFISGSSLIAGTVGAAQLIAGSAVITGTAQIANAIVSNAHIQEGAITNAKIGNIIQSTDYNANLKRGWQINKIGNITTYGRLTVKSPTTGETVFDASGLSGTFIKDATITSAKIGYAQIDGAHIKDLAVDTLQIAGNAITVPVFAYTGGSITGNCVNEVVIQATNVVAQNVMYRLKIDTDALMKIIYNFQAGIPIINQMPGSIELRLYYNNSLVQRETTTEQPGITSDPTIPWKIGLPPIMLTIPAHTVAKLKYTVWFPSQNAAHKYTIYSRSISALGVKR